jgi:hypothetical protein
MSASDKIADFTISKLNSIFDTVSHALPTATKYALPTATKYALEVTSIDCLVTILYGLEFTVLASVTTGFVFWGYVQPVESNSKTTTMTGKFPTFSVLFVGPL